MKPRTNTCAGRPLSDPDSSSSIAERGTFVDAETSPTVRDFSSLARRRQFPKWSSSMESGLSNARLLDEFSLTFLDSYCLISVRNLTVRGKACQLKYLIPDLGCSPISADFYKLYAPSLGIPHILVQLQVEPRRDPIS